MRTTDGLLTRLRQTEPAHLALAHQVRHHPHHILDRHLRVHTMLVEQVDAVGLEATERTFHRRADERRLARHADVAAFLETKAELGGDDDPVACAGHGPERAGQQFLVRVRPIHFGGVEQGHAEVYRPVDGRDRLAIVTLGGSAVGHAHAHQAKPDRRGGETLRAERAGGEHDRLLPAVSAVASPGATRCVNARRCVRCRNQPDPRGVINGWPQ